MAQQTENSPGAMMPSLEAKLRQLAAGLTPQDEAQLRALQQEASTGELSPSLQAKFQQCATELTPLEATQVRLLLQLARVGAAAGGEDDNVGYAAALYEGDFGNKGRPQPGTPANAVGRDPASIVTDTGYNLVTLLSPLGNWLQYGSPF
jgi:hypothetical protein